jgi:hypothetical protein
LVGVSIKKYSSKKTSIPFFKSSIVLNQFELVTLYLRIFQHVSIQFNCGLYVGKNSIKIFLLNEFKKFLEILALCAGALSKIKTYFLFLSKIFTNFS